MNQIKSFYDKLYGQASSADLEVIEQIEMRDAFYGRATRQRISSLLPNKIGIAIDIGCGVGRNSIFLLQNYHPERVFGLDISRGTVSIWQRRMIYRGFDSEAIPLVADAQQLPFKSESFDLVLCCEVMEHLPNDKSCLKEIARILKPDGLAIMSIPHAHLSLFDYLRGKKPKSIAYDVNEIITKELPNEGLQRGGDLRCYTLSELEQMTEECGLIIQQHGYVGGSLARFSMKLWSLLMRLGRKLFGVQQATVVDIFQGQKGSRVTLIARAYKRFLVPLFNLIFDIDRIFLGKVNYGQHIVLKLGKQ